MSIRNAAPADWPELHRVRMAVLENRLADPARVRQEDYLRMLHTGRGWVWEVDGQVAGFCIADLQNASIWALFVRPAFERRGIGRRLHDAAVEWLFGCGVPSISLTTEAGTRAERFYRSAGWERTGVAPNGDTEYVLRR
jgi:GNAT superfamily N-acetyltransferase